MARPGGAALPTWAAGRRLSPRLPAALVAVTALGAPLVAPAPPDDLPG